MKRYKALMLDLDGTTIPNKENGMPSKKIIDSVAKASRKLHVGVVTARPYYAAKPVTKALSLNGPSIIFGGAQIVDLATDTILWEQKLSPKNVNAIYNMLKKWNLSFFIQERTKSDIEPDEEFNPHAVINFSIPEISPEVAESIMEDLKNLKEISMHKLIGYEKNKVWIQISHAEATKQYAIYEVAKILDIEPHEIIGVGEGYNDFPLLMACGLKVAMGNAVSDLKEIADYIAPTVDEDGVADVISKFVL